MKKRRNMILGALLSVILVLTSVMSCTPEAAPGAAPSSVVPVSSNTYSLGRSGKGWKDLYLYGSIYTDNGTITIPQDNTVALVGLNTTDTLTNKTLTSPTINGASLSGTLSGTPTFSGAVTFSGTPTFANQASGNASTTAGSATAIITHGLGSTATRFFWSYSGGVPGNSTNSTGANPAYWTADNATTVTLHFGGSVNATVGINWIAYISDE